MNKLIACLLALILTIANLARADDQQVDTQLTFNVEVLSDYRARGISQSRLEPALQGGADYVSTSTGMYAGTWLSTIIWIDDQGGRDNLEWDFYAGKRGKILDIFSYDAGVMVYTYPRNDLAVNANSSEVYGQLGYQSAYVKYSYSVGNLFGFVDSKGSGYLDIGANIKSQYGLTLNLHAGHQIIVNSNSASYTDWKIGATKNFGLATGALAVIGTNTHAYTGSAPQLANLGKIGLIVTISKVF